MPPRKFSKFRLHLVQFERRKLYIYVPKYYSAIIL